MITDHQFTVRRQDGIGPHGPLKPCSTCGKHQMEHRRPCDGFLTISGQSHACELAAPHDGWGHSNKAAQAVWQ